MNPRLSKPLAISIIVNLFLAWSVYTNWQSKNLIFMHGYENFMVSSYRLNNAMSEYLTNRDHASQARVVELSLSAFTQADIFYSYYRNQIGYDLTYSLKNNFDRITMLFSEQPTIEEIDPYKLFIEELIKTSKAGTLEYGTFPNHPYNLEHAKKLLKVSEESKVTPK